MLYYIIVYPRGDRSKLCVAQARDYEINTDWAVASRERFNNDHDGLKAACTYARELAKTNSLQYVPYDRSDYGDHDYLD